MNCKKWMVMLGMVVISSQSAMAAREGGIPFRIWNRLRVEYDDNYDEVKDNTRSSFKVVDEVEVALDLNLQQTFIGFNVRPSFIWWQDRPGDSTDFHVYADVILNHSFSRRATFSIRNAFRRAEAPELIQDGNTYRENGDYYYNSAEAALSVLVRPKFYTDFSGGYSFIRYDKKQMADEHNYDKYRAGARARYQLLPETELSGAFGYESVKYKDSWVDRDSTTLLGSVGLEHIFSPNLLGSANLGVQSRETKAAFTDKETSPYADFGLTVLPSPATRLTLGASYMMTETDVFPYSEQTRIRGYASMSYDITANLSFTLSGSYTKGDYDAENLPKEATIVDLPTKEYRKIKAANPNIPDNTKLNENFVNPISDQSETSLLMATALSYQMNRNNWLELGWRHTTLDSDLREEFDRNLFHAGWKLKL